MISLVMVALKLTLDFARGGVPAAEPSFRAGLCEVWEFFFLSIDSACAVSNKLAFGEFIRPRMISLTLGTHIQTLDFCCRPCLLFGGVYKLPIGFHVVYA